MKRQLEKENYVISLPIPQLACGEIAPPLEPNHPSWKHLSKWDDSSAPYGGYTVPSGKKRIDKNNIPAIEFSNEPQKEKSLVTGETTWRDYNIECKFEAIQTDAGPSWDGWFLKYGMAGIVFRMKTSRRFYYFCLEGRKRLVLFRRIDDEWFELASQNTDIIEQPITMFVQLFGDGIKASCPELDIEFSVTDTFLKSGKTGFRTLGKSYLYDLQVTMTNSQQSINDHIADKYSENVNFRSTLVAKERKVGEINVGDDKKLVSVTNFYKTDRNDLLYITEQGLLATSWQGETLWYLPEKTTHIQSTPEINGAKRIYALVGERQVMKTTHVSGATGSWSIADQLIAIDGKSGQVLYRTKLPEVTNMETVRQFDFAFEGGCLVSDQPLDIAIRLWRDDLGGGGQDLWAYDQQLNMLWERQVYPPYGHHNSVHLIDLNGDGKSEILAGGTLLNANGDILWVHDMCEEIPRIFCGDHYDACLIGNFSGEPAIDPIAFLLGGSAGIYVVDALTGKTKAVHQPGHAQWGMVCKVRDDIPGKQIMAGTRWGNFGILTLYSGRGERLWSIQPDYILQGTRPVQWEKSGPQHIWHNTSRPAQGLYDGYGQLVQPLHTIRQLIGERIRNKVKCQVLKTTPNSQELLAVEIDKRIHLFEPQV